MTSLLSPFSGLIPAVAYADRIVGPPSSLLTREQKQASRLDELSFRHAVGRGAGATAQAATAWLDRCHNLTALQTVESSIIVHRLTNGDFTATGLLADVSLDAYDSGRVKRHEATIAKTERKMLNYMASTRIFGNPVSLAHRAQPDIATALTRHSQREPDLAFSAVDGTHHSMWIVEGNDALHVCALFNEVLYITDGHHRLAAASILAANEVRPDPRIPAGVFSEDELQVWAFARAIRDDAIVGPELVRTLSDHFELHESDLAVPRPVEPNQLGVRIDGRSFLLTIPLSQLPTTSYEQLDVNLLQDLVLEPLIGVTDPRSDDRLSFVADTGDDAHDADAYDAWFLPYPTQVRDVMMAADAGQAMPPKSTYFLPKLPSGLVIRPIDG